MRPNLTPGCSFLVDHVGGALPHLFARDVAFAAVSRATVPQIESFKKRMGWTFKWVSSNRNDFNWDFQVSFTKEQLRRFPARELRRAAAPSAARTAARGSERRIWWRPPQR